MEFPQRIVFRGEVIEGFDAEEVKLSAKSRLNASLNQIEQLFSGRPAILKKNLDAVSGARYLALLAHIGMRASLEQQSTEAKPEPQTPAQATAAPFDPERTQLAGAAELSRYINDAPPPAPAAVPEPVAEPKAKPVAVPVTAREPVSIPERVASEVRRASLSRPPEPSITAQPPLAPLPPPRISPAQQTDPQTVFFEEETASQTKTPASPTKTGMRWPERLLLALIAAGIGYTLYWVVTRY